jgi:hypothetical protein
MDRIEKVSAISAGAYSGGVSSNTGSGQIFPTQNRDLDRGVTLERQAVQPAARQQSAAALRQALNDAMSSQGIIGRGFDFAKNLTGLGAGSNRAQEAITKFENGEMEFDEAVNAIQNYLQSQRIAVDTFANTASIIAGGLTFAVLTAGEVIAAPLTGGASLAGIAVNTAGAGLVGAGANAGIQAIEHMTGGTTYTLSDELKDMGRGFVLGATTAATPAIANAAAQGARTVLPQTTTAAGQVAARLTAAGAGAGTASATAGGVNAGANTLIEGGSLQEATDAASRGIVTSGLTGFVFGAGFEAAAIAAGAPRPGGTTARNFTTRDGVEIKQYLNDRGELVAFDIRASDLPKINPNFRPENGLRTVRVTPQHAISYHWHGDFGQSMNAAEFANSLRTQATQTQSAITPRIDTTAITGQVTQVTMSTTPTTATSAVATVLLAPLPPRDISDLIGPEHQGVRGQDAIDLLFQEQNGHIRAAFYREEIGEINLVWGDEKSGLSHIIQQRQKQGIPPERFLSDLGEVIEKGEITLNDRGAYEIFFNKKLVVVTPQLQHNEFPTVLTAYRTNKRNPRVERSSN